ncbi:MAG: recombinase family protein [Candidatus Andersenbacteria bacterium]
MTEAVIYARVSSSKQISEGHGNDSQIQAGKKFADFKNWKVLKSFEEPGISGAITKRPAMGQMIEYLKDRHKHNKETFVIVDDLKRFSRDIGGYLELKEIVVSCGAKLASPKFNFEDSPEGEFFELLTVLTGQLDRKQNRRQVIDRMKSRLEMGYWVFPTALPGLQIVKESGHGKVMRRREPEASIYSEALEGFADNRFATQAAMANFLGQRLNKKFSIQSARDTLDRAILYAGYIEYPKWDVSRRKGHHDALITLETCIKIQERLNGSVRRQIRKDVNPDFPLRGRVRCGECNATFRAAWCKGRSEKYPKYWCSNKACSHYANTMTKKEVEGDFAEILKLIKPQERTLEAVKLRTLRKWDKRINDVVAYHSSIQREAKAITEQTNELIKRIGITSNRTVAMAYEKRIEALELERLALEEKEANFRPDNFDYRTGLEQVINFIKDPYSRWNSGILHEQNMVLDICFSSDVTYHPKEGYRTTQISPTFAYLTNNTGTFEGTSEVRLKGCGRGRN